MKQDRFLLTILVAIGGLVVVAVGLFFTRERSQSYGPENTPEGILHNYILAIEAEEYQRAYGYLQDADGKPDFDDFRRAFLTRQLDPSNTAVQIGESKPSGTDVIVGLVLVRGGNSAFETTFRESTNALLVKDSENVWKLASLPYPYWGWDWYQPKRDVRVESP